MTITFDHHDQARAGGYGLGRVFTMRYDTDPYAKTAAQFCIQYPPPKGAHWLTDGEGVLFELITAAADKAIRKRAADDPETYSAMERA